MCLGYLRGYRGSLKAHFCFSCCHGDGLADCARLLQERCDRPAPGEPQFTSDGYLHGKSLPITTPVPPKKKRAPSWALWVSSGSSAAGGCRLPCLAWPYSARMVARKDSTWLRSSSDCWVSSCAADNTSVAALPVDVAPWFTA